MNGRTLIRRTARIASLGVVVALVACASAPAPPQELSILESIDAQQSSLGPASCAALNATAVCQKSTRLDSGRNCRCVDPRAFGNGSGALRL
jgi:hypothetical protein